MDTGQTDNNRGQIESRGEGDRPRGEVENASKMGEKINKESLRYFDDFENWDDLAVGIPLQMTIQEIMDERKGRWFEFEFDRCRVERLVAEDISPKIIFVFEGKGMRMKISQSAPYGLKDLRGLDRSLKELLRDCFYDAFRGQSKLPEDCTPIYNQMRVE
jgi:hypothetical protein